MKRIEVLMTKMQLQDEEFKKTSASIKSSVYQSVLRQNAKKIDEEFKELMIDLNSLKSDEFKAAIKKDPNSPETLKLAQEFEASKEVQDLYKMDSLIELRKIELKDLPDDLDGKQMDVVYWLLKDND